MAAEFGGQQVFVTQRGAVVRPRDGELLFRPRGGSGDEGWSPPVIQDNTMYLPKFGVSQLNLWDFSGVTGDDWKPNLAKTVSLPETIHRHGDKEGWVDRWTAGSPLLWNDIAYTCDIYQVLYAAHLKTGQMLYRQELELEGFTHYNAVAVAASPTLIGDVAYVLDNQGTAIVFSPGEKFKPLARNRIATQLERSLPLPAQETLAYAPPVVAGDRLYVRGERYLYCIGQHEGEPVIHD